MKKRTSTIKRQTKETNVFVSLNIDGKGQREIETPVGFLNHMLDQFCQHGMFDLKIKASGDVQVGKHHLVEDVAICLGKTIKKALVEKRGIKRFGFSILPMQETLATVAVDLSGRSNFCFSCEFKREKVGDLPTELVYDFWNSFAKNAKIALHIKVENGRNEHHKIEAVFKATALALRMACEIDAGTKDKIPSTKGVL